MNERQEALFEILVAQGLNLLFLALLALLLWPLDRLRMALDLTKAYCALWIVIDVAALLVYYLQRWFRVNEYDHSNAYVISNLAVSCFLQMGWSVFAAVTVQRFVAAAPVWIAIILYLAGAFSCLIAFFAVSSIYQGAVYKLISLPVALISFLVFSVWPAGGRAIYGWVLQSFVG